MPDRSFPLSLAVLGTVKLGANEHEEKVALTKLVQDGQRADQSRQTWLQRQIALSKLRFGIRKPKDFPWPKASNLGIPLIDSQIRRMKPLLVKLLVQPDPIVEFVGEDPDAVGSERMAEAEYNWLFKTHMKAIEPMCYVIDSILHRGFGIAQVGWDYKTEYECRVVITSDLFPPARGPDGQPQSGIPQDPQAILSKLVTEYDLDPNDPRVAKPLGLAVEKILRGDPAVKLAFKRVITDRPAVWDRDPVQMIVPPRTTDYGSAEWVIVQHLLPLRTLQQMEADGFFDPGFCKKIQGTISKGDAENVSDSNFTGNQSLDQMRNFEDEKERIWGHENDGNVLIWECYHWHDIDRDGLLDRTVTFVHPRSLAKGCSRPYIYPFHRWPFVKFDFEKTSRRFHSPRGVSGMLEHLNREINAQHNARIDAMTLRNAPVYQVPVLAGFKAKNFRAVPGTVIQLPLGAQITPVGHDRASFPESINEEANLRSLAEGYIGSFDNTLTSAAGDNRTATEVNAAVQLAASTASLDTILFQLQMTELHELIWELWLDLRPQEVAYKVLGQSKDTNEPTLITVKKGDIAKRFKLHPTGTIANTNHALELSNAREALTFFAGDQTGAINEFELRRWYFSLLDTRVARRVIRPESQAAYVQQLMQAAAALKQDPGLAAGMNTPVDASTEIPANTEIINPSSAIA